MYLQKNTYKELKSNGYIVPMMLKIKETETFFSYLSILYEPISAKERNYLFYFNNALRADMLLRALVEGITN